MRVQFIVVSLISFLLISLLACANNPGTKKDTVTDINDSIIVGAERTNLYLPLLKNKRIAVVANPSSIIKQTHLVDSLISLNVNIVKVMSPEHGFRGKAAAGISISSGTDAKTSLAVISLYGAHKKPTAKDLHDVDIVLFDLQDVGTRFYTYLSTLHLCMEACAENAKELIILDRPNPNGYYVDGPILEPQFSSFVGMDPIPIVHGMTLGEYAKMLNGEGWLENREKCKLTVIKVKNYSHKSIYTLPVKPSPNLPNAIAINLYPSLCLFEGTVVSVGRGTGKPFQLYGYPNFKNYDTTFTPKPIASAAPHPKLEGKKCYGYSLCYYTNQQAYRKAGINLQWLINAYHEYGKSSGFFNSFFYKLAGTKLLSQQIEAGLNEKEIKQSWEKGLDKFKIIRRKYLLYTDFE